MSTLNDTSKLEIPYGYCHCGCGQKTRVAPRDDHKSNVLKGESYRYLRGHAAKPPLPPDENFWSKVDKSRGNDSCWLWTRFIDDFGYGYTRWGSRCIHTHRIAWFLTYGDIPDGLWVLHNCPEGDNPACVNPAHLWLGTVQDNNADRDRKGRGADHHGENNPAHKFTDRDIETMRELFASGIKRRAIRKTYGISNAHLGKILKHERRG